MSRSLSARGRVRGARCAARTSRRFPSVMPRRTASASADSASACMTACGSTGRVPCSSERSSTRANPSSRRAASSDEANSCSSCALTSGGAKSVNGNDTSLRGLPGRRGGWSTGRPATLGGAVLERFHRNGGGHVDAVQEDRGDVIVPFSLRAAYDAYVSEAWRGASSNFRLSERSLRAFYGLKPLIPRPLQLAARRRLVRSQGVPDFPAWPLDLSVSRLLRFYA